VAVDRAEAGQGEHVGGDDPVEAEGDDQVGAQGGDHRRPAVGVVGDDEVEAGAGELGDAAIAVGATGARAGSGEDADQAVAARVQQRLDEGRGERQDGEDDAPALGVAFQFVPPLFV